MSGTESCDYSVFIKAKLTPNAGSFRLDILHASNVIDTFYGYNKLMYGKQTFFFVLVRNYNDCLITSEVPTTSAKINNNSIELKIM